MKQLTHLLQEGVCGLFSLHFLIKHKLKELDRFSTFISESKQWYEMAYVNHNHYDGILDQLENTPPRVNRVVWVV